jgi:hypothetical protein
MEILNYGCFYEQVLTAYDLVLSTLVLFGSCRGVIALVTGDNKALHALG